jgi:hypothetical protein
MLPSTLDSFAPVTNGHGPAPRVTLTGPTPNSPPLTIADADTPTTTTGAISVDPRYTTTLSLTAGVTYTFAERPTAVGGIQDPYLLLANGSGTIIAQDDDGGLGRSSMITFTPTTTGTYYLYASSWYHEDPTAPGYPDYRDVGGYTIDMWQADAATDAPATIAGAVAIGLGTTYGHLNTAGDKDMYKVQLNAGEFYTFTYAGGIAGGSEYPNPVAGDNIGILRLYDANGVQIAAAVNYETGLSLIPETTGTYYLRIEGYDATMTGGYTLDFTSVNPADHDPLDSIDWFSAGNIPTTNVNGTPTAYVYFAPASDGGFGSSATTASRWSPTAGSSSRSTAS